MGVKKRASRESRQIDDMEMGVDEPIDEMVDLQRSVSPQDNHQDTSPKRLVKSRAAPESKQMDDITADMQLDEEIGDFEVIEHEEGADTEHQKEKETGTRTEKEIVTVRDDNLGYNMQIDSMTKKTVKRQQARGSMQIEQPVLTASVLETFAEDQREDEAAAVLGPVDDASAEPQAHARTDTMNSNSTAYR